MIWFFRIVKEIAETVDSHFEDLACKTIFVNEAFHQVIGFPAGAGRKERRYAVAFFRGFGHFNGFFPCAGHARLTQNMFAGVEGGQRGGAMQYRRSCDQDCVDIGHVDDLVPVVDYARDVKFCTSLFGMFEGHRPCRGDFNAFDLFEVWNVFGLGNVADSDYANFNVFHKAIFPRIEMKRIGRPLYENGV